MLTKGDKEFIDESIQKNVRKAQVELLEEILIPYLDQKYGENKREHNKTQEKITIICEHIADHEKRITKLEQITNVPK